MNCLDVCFNRMGISQGLAIEITDLHDYFEVRTFSKSEGIRMV